MTELQNSKPFNLGFEVRARNDRFKVHIPPNGTIIEGVITRGPDLILFLAFQPNPNELR